MSKHRFQEKGVGREEAGKGKGAGAVSTSMTSGQRDQERLTPGYEATQKRAKTASAERWNVDMTPGRAPAEGEDMDINFGTPSHERWEQDTFDRDPTEGPETESPSRQQSRK